MFNLYDPSRRSEMSIEASNGDNEMCSSRGNHKAPWTASQVFFLLENLTGPRSFDAQSADFADKSAIN